VSTGLAATARAITAAALIWSCSAGHLGATTGQRDVAKERDDRELAVPVALTID